MIGRAEIVIIQKLFEDKQMVPEIMKQHFRGLQLFVKNCAGFPAQGFLGIWRRGLFLQLRHPGQVLEAEKSDAEQKHQHEGSGRGDDPAVEQIVGRQEDPKIEQHRRDAEAGPEPRPGWCQEVAGHAAHKSE